MGLLIQPKAAPRGTVHIIDPPANLGPNIRITPQARYYALAELTRRAGIPVDFFRKWKVTVTREKTVFEISNGTSKFISFPHATPKHLKDLAAGKFSYVTVPLVASLAGADDSSVSYCVVPFVAPMGTEVRPLFYLADQNHLECAVDLPLSILLTLSRWEELQDAPRDLHGRFQANSSIASAGGFLNRPIIDEYGLAFEQAMELLYPSWKKSERKLRIKVSHDADHIGIPFRWRTAVRHSLRSRAPFNSVRDMSSVISTSVEPAELRSVRDIVTASLKHRLEFHRLLEGRASRTDGQWLRSAPQESARRCGLVARDRRRIRSPTRVQHLPLPGKVAQRNRGPPRRPWRTAAWRETALFEMVSGYLDRLGELWHGVRQQRWVC